MISEEENEPGDDTAIRTVANMVSSGLNRYVSAGDNVNQIGILYLLTALSLLNIAKDMDNNDQVLTTARRLASQGLSKAARVKS